MHTTGLHEFESDHRLLNANSGICKEVFMIRKISFALLVALTSSMIAEIVAVSQASASDCHYTSQDRKKGYKC